MKMMMMRWWGDVALSLTLTKRGRGTLAISHTTGLTHWHIQILLHTGEDTPFTHSGTQSGGHTHPRTHPHTHPCTHPHTHLHTYPYTHPHGETWRNGETLTLTYPFTCWHTLDNKPYLCARIVRFTEPKCYNLKVQWEVRSHSAPIRRTLLKLRFCAKSQEFHDGMIASLCRVQGTRTHARST